MRFPIFALVIILGIAACSEATAPKNASPAESAILKHKYWISKQYNDALFADNISDTLAYFTCGELLFLDKDSMLFTGCLSDAGLGFFKVSSPTTLEIKFEGYEDKAPAVARLDEASGVLHLEAPFAAESGWPKEFVAQDGINPKDVDNVTINLARKRLAGAYTLVPAPGEMAHTALIELRADGTQSGLGDFDVYEPWTAGIGGGAIQQPARNVMYLSKRGKEEEAVVLGWQVRGDTLRLWDTRNINGEEDMPEYRTVNLRGVYVKSK